MRINNNMLAINTHRQMGGVALMQAKSMEKLSSGYRINRAGDDAAGLAISEKMRAQIRGLHTAAKNAQDGISLIQTAEGSLQEVHSMLNRMVELATQSANGTFDDAVDRKNLESEVIALKDEIDRVAKSANFNGIKLLNGDLASAASKSKVADVMVHGVSGQDATGGTNDVIEIIKASDSKFSGVFNTGAAAGAAALKFITTGDVEQSIKAQVNFRDDNGNMNVIEIDLKAAAKKDVVNWADSVIKLNGKALDSVKIGQKIGELKLEGTTNNFTTAVQKVLSNVNEFDKAFKVTAMKTATEVAADVANSKMLKVEARNTGTKAEAISVLFNQTAQVGAAGDNLLKDVALTDVQGAKKDKITVHGAKIWSLASTHVSDEEVDKATVSVNGEKFIIVNKADQSAADVIDTLKKKGFDEKHIIYSDAAGTAKTSAIMTEADVKNFAKAINDRFEKEVVKAEGTDLIFEGEDIPAGQNEGLTLQVGDSSEDFQKITVKVNDMSSRGLGIASVSVAEQGKAADSIKLIKDAINTVSSTRGDLGALQNRLEHTIANINTTAENITASESRIRDVDMAKEMVELTKANILQQAAQAMLAQANQAPQGVLQLLR